MVTQVRRRVMLAGAATALVAGVGTALWQRRLPQGEQADRPDDPSLWNLQFDQPDGGRLAMQTLRGQPLVINFWATWCPPCIRELPELERFQREFGPSGWRVLALAIDREQPVREFLTKMPLKLTVALGGIDGLELGRRLGNDQGGLPFSVVLDATGRVTQRKAGQTHFKELSDWARAAAG